MTKIYHHNHMFHLISISPWPIIISFKLFNNLISTIMWFHKMNYLVLISIPCTILCMYLWWRDILRESTYQGLHTYFVYLGLRLGMILFIISEMFFLFHFFELIFILL